MRSSMFYYSLTRQDEFSTKGHLLDERCIKKCLLASPD